MNRALTRPIVADNLHLQFLVHVGPPLPSSHLAFLTSAPLRNAKALLMGVCKASMFLNSVALETKLLAKFSTGTPNNQHWRSHQGL